MATSERISLSLRSQVSEQARTLRILRCPAHFTNASFHCEHIRPRSAGGRTSLDNLAWACPWCNAHKYTKTHAHDPHTGRQTPLFNPRRQRWSRHFAWSADFMYIIGRTRTGRATVDALRLNRPQLLNLRRLLYAAGEHPPKVE